MPDIRTPYEHTLYLINHTNQCITDVTRHPDGSPRNIDSTATVGVLIANSNLAIASALLALTDAVKGRQS